MKILLRALGPAWVVFSLCGTLGCKKDVSVSPGNSSDPVTVIPFTQDSSMFQSALTDYRENYLGSNVTSIGWTGNVSDCDAGATPDTLKQRVLQRVNYFRRMSGLPPVTLNDSLSAMCQDAALMMKRNNALNHYPPSNWSCTTTSGQLAAANSNLALGVGGPCAVDMYIQDAGEATLGHRRWILYPSLTVVGTGDTDFSNALWVVGNFGPRPAVDFVAYPGPGYVPAPVVYNTWSISIPSADFSSASVLAMKPDGSRYSLTVAPAAPGYGDNTLEWSFNDSFLEPDDITADQQVNVTVSGVKVNGQVRSYRYTVYVFVPKGL